MIRTVDFMQRFLFILSFCFFSSFKLSADLTSKSEHPPIEEMAERLLLNSGVSPEEFSKQLGISEDKLDRFIAAMHGHPVAELAGPGFSLYEHTASRDFLRYSREEPQGALSPTGKELKENLAQVQEEWNRGMADFVGVSYDELLRLSRVYSSNLRRIRYKKKAVATSN